ncbi:MAG: T9SS type A sorting domain-containing protein [Bacteroidota bacterium]
MKYTLLLISLACGIITHAQILKNNNTGGSAFLGTVTQTVNFNGGDFGSGITAADVQVSISWSGEEPTGIFFNEAIDVTLTSPSGTSVKLVYARAGSNTPTYGYNAGALSTWGTVTTTFSDSAPSAALGTDHPMNGTWRPHDPLSVFIGESPVGDWQLSFSYINFLGTDVLKWDDFTIGITGGLMPVELTKFQAKEVENGQVHLDWQTASERDNDYFLLERSINAKDWESIAKIKGAGTAFEQIDYQFIDRPIQKGTIYYRLKQVDFEGTYEYSEIIPLDLKGEKEKQFQIFPNPADQFIKLKNAVGKVTIYNTLNQVILSVKNEEEDFIFDTADLPSGQYMIQCMRKNYEVQKQLFIKS